MIFMKVTNTLLILKPNKHVALTILDLFAISDCLPFHNSSNCLLTWLLWSTLFRHFSYFLGIYYYSLLTGVSLLLIEWPLCSSPSELSSKQVSSTSAPSHSFSQHLSILMIACMCLLSRLLKLLASKLLLHFELHWSSISTIQNFYHNNQDRNLEPIPDSLLSFILLSHLLSSVYECWLILPLNYLFLLNSFCHCLGTISYV